MATWYSQGSGLWSTLANWNDAANGSGSAPASIAAFDDSPVVIQAGHVVEFDVEDAVACDGSISGWTTGIAGITITGAAAGNTPGELTLTDTANNANRVYGLRLKAGTKVVGTNVAVLGKVTGGTESVPIPTDAVHIIQFIDPTTTGGFDLTYLSLALYCAPPVETAYVTTANAGIGDSVLSVEGRLTGCNPNTDTTEWQVGREVIVCRVDPTAPGRNVQTTTIAGVGDGTITLADTLTATKATGSMVVLTQRNIEIRDATTSTTGAPMRMLAYGGAGAVFDCAFRLLPATPTQLACISHGNGNMIQGSAVLSGGYYGSWGGTSHTWHGSSVVVDCNYSLYSCISHVTDDDVLVVGASVGCIHSGTSTIARGRTTCAGSTSAIVSGDQQLLADTSIICCSNAVLQPSNAYVSHTATISGCATNFRVDTADDSVFSYSTPANGTLVYSDYKLNVAPVVATPRVEIWPAGYTAAGTGDVTRRYPGSYIYGSYPATWCNGGKTQSQSSVLPTGHTVGGQMIFEQHADIITAGVKANYCWNWVAVPVTVGANQRARITVNVRKDTSFAGYTETPMVQVVDALYDGTNIDTDTLLTSSMADTQDVWQTFTFTVATAGLYFVRIIGRHDTGNLYYTITATVSTQDWQGHQVKPARGWRITDGAWDETLRGIEGLWQMTDGSGTVVADASGHGRHGTASGVTWVAGPSGWATNYAAANATVTLPADLAAIIVPTGEYTMHVRARTAQMADGYLLACTDGTDVQAAIWSDNGVPTLTVGGASCVAPLWMTDNLWHSITATVSAGTATLYLDGVAVSSVAAGVTTGGVDVRIGTRNPGADDWDGEVDHAAIWSRALSASEVRRLHEQPPWMVG